MFTAQKCHSFIMKTCTFGRLTHIEFSDNLLTTSVNLKQVASPCVHRCFDNLTTFYKKNYSIEITFVTVNSRKKSLKRGFNSLKRGFNSLKRDCDSLKRDFLCHLFQIL